MAKECRNCRRLDPDRVVAGKMALRLGCRRYHDKVNSSLPMREWKFPIDGCELWEAMPQEPQPHA